MGGRKIIHVDMDSFYAAVEVKHRPELKGKPIGVGGPPNSRSVLCTASYEARKFGVRAAMPSSIAVRKCPQLILIPPNFERYKAASREVHRILGCYTDKIEPLSLDEAYLDVTGVTEFHGSATLIAQDIRRRIQSELGLTASAGVAANKFLAKIASDWKKPNGLFVIRPEAVEGFVKNLKVESLFGVGKVTALKMHSLGLHTCSDIQQVSVYQMQEWFGSRGRELHDLAFGLDSREVDTSSERKSLTVEETYNRDLMTLQECLAKLPELYEDWQRRLERAKAQSLIRGLVVKVKYFDFKATTHEAASAKFPTIMDFSHLLERTWQRRQAPVRLLGLGVRLGGENSSANSQQLSLDVG